MERYSFEKAQEAAEKIKPIADDIKEKRTSSWEDWRKPQQPNTKDYERANTLVDSGYEENLISYNESRKLSSELLEKYKDRILNEEGENWDKDDVADPDKAIIKFMGKVPTEILAGYYGHGITRGDTVDKLAAMINIAQNNCIVGATGTLDGWVYTTGLFLVISKYKENLLKFKNGDTIFHTIKGPSSFFEEGRKIPHADENGERQAYEANVGAIIVNLSLYPMVEELKELFPNVNIIKANEIEDYIMNEVKRYNSKASV